MPKSASSALSLSGQAVPLATLQEARGELHDPAILPVTVLIATKNEARNLPACLKSVDRFGEVVVIDSQSSDATVEVARSFGADVVQFHYRGGWPKKRQWALDELPLRHEWVLLLDADESVTPQLLAEIREAIADPTISGCYIGLDMIFLGHPLRHCGASFNKLSLFRRAAGSFECRREDQDTSMCDMEVHEHVMVRGGTRTLRNRLLHRNVESLSRYIQKHNDYSNWEVCVWDGAEATAALKPSLQGSQAQRRRWLKQRFLRWPGSPFFFFLYRYVLRAGFLDGMPGLIYCAFQAIQIFHIKAKLYERELSASSPPPIPLTGGSHVRN